MARRASIDAMIDQIVTLRSAGTIDATALDLLRQALAARASLVVAKAAAVMRDRRIAGLESELAMAFDRFMAAGSDKGCLAKHAIAEALYEIGADAGELFLRGAQHVQPEPAYGGSGDAAAELRGICALGLVRCGHPLAMEVLADLLADPEVQVRIMAARGLGYLGHDHGALLLRLRVLAGDREDDVIAECLQQIVRLSPRGLEFAARFLDGPQPALQQAAAMALAGSRQPRGLSLLIDRWERSQEKPALALAIATHRSAEAIEFLLARLGDADERTAARVLEALRTYRGDEAAWSRVVTVARERGLAIGSASGPARSAPAR